ncbi:hypothetical protein AcetOrient_orf00117 [Acetobacter orientalis]|uniref:Uncharacterized protein n=1 Tax=Acetobacter orientalis TaxID=146474 RepID=A0A2Z5ZD83_9PROT|nr:hypothetical protein AcetOrient_orf00117 [Acetobacter orientalis]
MHLAPCTLHLAPQKQKGWAKTTHFMEHFAPTHRLYRLPVACIEGIKTIIFRHMQNGTRHSTKARSKQPATICTPVACPLSKMSFKYAGTRERQNR